MKNDSKRLVFIGGHHTSAVAVIDALLNERKDVEIHFVGHKFSAYKDKNSSAEYREITQKNIPFYNLYAGKIYRTFNPIRLIRLPFGFFQALFFLLKIKPSLVVSFGGYLAVPITIWAYIMRIPIITHEQTLQGGWANIFVSKLANRILLTWESSLAFFPKEKSRVIGLPLIINFKEADITKGVFKENLPLVFVTGGKQGAHIINETVSAILKNLTDFCNIIIQCGDNSYFRDFDRLNEQISFFPAKNKGRVLVKKFLSREEQLTAIQKANLLVGRSGAHFVYELCFYKKPALLIPLPNTSHNEQYNNAQFVKEAGLARVLNQDVLTGKTLLEEIKLLLEDSKKYFLKKEISLPKDASQKFVEEINKII
ncbi:MAG: glycosyltransferase [Patescibacteria group bacterium]